MKKAREAAVRILIADDHEIIRRGVRSLLQVRPTYDICGEAVDGQDAIAMAAKLKPDVVIMDVSMPGMNGLDATRILRREIPHHGMNIVAAEIEAGGITGNRALFGGAQEAV